MSDKENSRKTLLDSDVVRHFLKGGLILELPNILENIVLLDVVRDELLRSEHLQTKVTNFIQFGKIEIIAMPTKGDVLIEFARLKKAGLGIGESACMAYACHNKSIIASSNLIDIKDYCTTNGIDYLTTLDILVIGVKKGRLTEIQCNEFIALVRARKSNLPDITIENYIQQQQKK